MHHLGNAQPVNIFHLLKHAFPGKSFQQRPYGSQVRCWNLSGSLDLGIQGPLQFVLEVRFIRGHRGINIFQPRQIHPLHPLSRHPAQG